MGSFLAINDYIIYLLSLFYLLVDSVAGILISKGLPNVGQIYKVALVLLMAVSVLARNRNGGLLVSFFFMLTCVIPLFSMLNYFSDFLQTCSTVFKILSVFIMFMYYKKWCNRKKLLCIVKVNYLTFLLNMLAGILGFATPMRSFGDESIGTRGFFFAGNEVAYTFVCLTFLMLYFYRSERKKWPLYMLSVSVSVLVATKACIAAVVGIIFADRYVVSDRRRRIFVVLLFLLLIVLLIVLFNMLTEAVPLLKYIVFKFEHQKSGAYPILNALLSGRVGRLPATNRLYESCFGFRTALFGMGVPVIIPGLEMDFFEVFYYFGIILFSVVFAFYFYVLYAAAVSRNTAVFVFNMLCILTSFLVGHVVYSLMGGIFFAMANGVVVRSGTEITVRDTRKKSRLWRTVFVFSG